MFKSILHQLCQEEGGSLPDYKLLDKTGPHHNPCFRALVIVIGNLYISPGMYTSSKEAQSQAAKLAINALNPPYQIFHGITIRDPTTVVGDAAHDISPWYKIDLLIYAQYHKLEYPTYEVDSFGPQHDRCYMAVVSIDGKTYRGPRSYPEKESAEHAAAKVAIQSFWYKYKNDGPYIQGRPIAEGEAQHLFTDNSPWTRSRARRNAENSSGEGTPGPKQQEEKGAATSSRGQRKGKTGTRSL